jgi:hypothetical protein
MNDLHQRIDYLERRIVYTEVVTTAILGVVVAGLATLVTWLVLVGWR